MYFLAFFSSKSFFLQYSIYGGHHLRFNKKISFQQCVAPIYFFFNLPTLESDWFPPLFYSFFFTFSFFSFSLRFFFFLSLGEAVSQSVIRLELQTSGSETRKSIPKQDKLPFSDSRSNGESFLISTVLKKSTHTSSSLSQLHGL